MKFLCEDGLDEFVLDSPFDLDEGEEITIVKQRGPIPDYPDDPNKPREFVVHGHFRGASLHGDLRVARDEKIAEGWTIMFARPGLPPVPDLRTAKYVSGQQKYFKISLKTGNVLQREVVTTIGGKKRTIIRPGSLRAEMKAEEIPHDWLRIQGRTPLPPLWPESLVDNWNKFLSLTRNELRGEGWSLARCKKIIETKEWKEWKKTRDPEALKPIVDLLPAPLSPEPPVGGTQGWPGVFYILDHGHVTLGTRRPFFYEYFIEDAKLFQGRLVLRLVERKIAKGDVVLPVGEEEVRPRQGTYWVFMTPTEPGKLVKPYILSTSAAEKGIVLPYGVAALPQSFQKAIPKEYRYWHIKDEKKRAEVLNTLRELWDGKSLDSLRPKQKHVLKTDNRFKLLYRAWRGQHVIRGGPSTREWILLFPKTRRVIALMNDPTKRDVVAAYTEDLPFDELWEIEGEQAAAPNTKLNPTKDTPCTIKEVDEGTYRMLDEGEGYFKVNFDGDTLKGTYFFREEEPGSGIWEVSQSKGPEITKQASKARFVLQRHELPERLGRSHWDIRIQEPNWDGLAEWNLFEDPFKANDLIAPGKVCDDLSWMSITSPESRDVGDVETKVIPLDEGEITIEPDDDPNPSALLERPEFVIHFSGKRFRGTWNVKREPDGWRFIRQTDVKITKADKKKQLVYGVVLAPYEVDSWLDYERPEEIEKAAHVYLLRMWEGQKPAMVGKEHKEPIHAIPVESFIAPVDFWYPGTPQTEEYKVKAGSWVLVTYIKDKKEFEKVLKGQYRGYSVQGLGRRKKAKPDAESKLT